MKFKINRDHFSNGLAQVLNVVGSKAAMPILSNVLIEAATFDPVTIGRTARRRSQARSSISTAAKFGSAHPD